MKNYVIWYINSGFCLFVTIGLYILTGEIDLGWLNSTVQTFLASIVIKSMEGHIKWQRNQ